MLETNFIVMQQNNDILTQQMEFIVVDQILLQQLQDDLLVNTILKVKVNELIEKMLEHYEKKKIHINVKLDPIEIKTKKIN